MDILYSARSGTIMSNDLLVTVTPNDKGINLTLDSIVIKQFGEDIEKTVLETLSNMEVKNINITINDKGALNYTIKARVETAVNRGRGISI
jgi:citrate lyase subunit gamma (acyl carrier protein)